MKRLPAVVAGLVLACLAVTASAAAAVGERSANRASAGDEGRNAPAGSGSAHEDAGGRVPARALQSGMSLDEAVDLVQRRYGGRVVRAETRRDGGETVHRIRLLSDDGRVITVAVNARTGRID